MVAVKNDNLLFKLMCQIGHFVCLIFFHHYFKVEQMLKHKLQRMHFMNQYISYFTMICWRIVDFITTNVNNLRKHFPSIRNKVFRSNRTNKIEKSPCVPV